MLHVPGVPWGPDGVLLGFSLARAVVSDKVRAIWLKFLGKCPKGKCPKGKCPRDKCPRDKCPKGKCS